MALLVAGVVALVGVVVAIVVMESTPSTDSSTSVARQKAEDVKHPAGPTDLTFTAIGDVHLGMTQSQLNALGYTGAQGSFGCWHFAATPDKPSVTWGPHEGVVHIDPPNAQHFQTAIGGIKAATSRLSSVLAEFKSYRIERHLNNDFGQGGDGVSIFGAGGVVNIAVGPRPGTSKDDSLRTVTSIAVSDAAHAGYREASCS
jgi:hypothetical protein